MTEPVKIILYSLLVLVGLGVVFGAVLAFAAKAFAVKSDPRVAKVREALPGANCGACGYSGCDAYANAIVEQGASVSLCPVGGAAVADKVAEVMGTGKEERARYVATVACRGGREQAKRKGVYDGAADCRAAMLVGGNKMCTYGCIGLGNCVRACPYDAIAINERGVADVSKEKCRACGLCVEACPKHIIALVPYDRVVQVGCRALERGRAVRDACSVGCIGCGLCAKTCPNDAITITDNIPVVDYKKCIGCGKCAEKCPTGAIYIDD
nr:RnfABCDGE type electron transport complex subunit B [Maliibacterium massiliense]